MARDLVSEDYYIARGGMIPVKWTAPEASSSVTIKFTCFNCTCHNIFAVGIALQEVLHCQ